jgi:hypothetical protein
LRALLPEVALKAEELCDVVGNLVCAANIDVHRDLPAAREKEDSDHSILISFHALIILRDISARKKTKLLTFVPPQPQFESSQFGGK